MLGTAAHRALLSLWERGESSGRNCSAAVVRGISDGSEEGEVCRRGGGGLRIIGQGGALRGAWGLFQLVG